MRLPSFFPLFRLSSTLGQNTGARACYPQEKSSRSLLRDKKGSGNYREPHEGEDWKLQVDVEAVFLEPQRKSDSIRLIFESLTERNWFQVATFLITIVHHTLNYISLCPPMIARPRVNVTIVVLFVPVSCRFKPKLVSGIPNICSIPTKESCWMQTSVPSPLLKVVANNTHDPKGSSGRLEIVH